LEQALVAALVEMLVTTPKQALERAGKAEEQEFALRLARESAAAEGARAENVARIGAETARYQADQQLAGTRAVQEAARNDPLAKAQLRKAEQDIQANEMTLAQAREQRAVEERYGPQAAERVPAEADYRARMKAIIGDDDETSVVPDRFDVQGVDPEGPRADWKVAEAGKILDELQSRQAPGPYQTNLVNELGDLLTQNLYKTRPSREGDDRGQLADAIIRHKQRMYGPGHAGVTREELTANPWAPGSLKAPAPLWRDYLGL
jgi:hypothetical protein